MRFVFRIGAIVGVLLACHSAQRAQAQHRTGWIPDASRDIAKWGSLVVPAGVVIPPKADLRPFMPPAHPKGQGQQGSCVGWAVSYAVGSYYNGIREGWQLGDGTKPIEEHVMSPAYIYNMLNNNEDIGIHLSAALGLLESGGTVPWSLMPYSETDFRTDPSERALAEAGKYRLSRGNGNPQFVRVWSPPSVGSLQTVKAALASGCPVVAGMRVDDSFMRYRGGAAWKSGARQKDAGYHAVCFIAYDDEKNAFLLMNSWGTDWGDNGCAWVDYDSFTTEVKYAWTLARAPEPKPAVRRAASAQFDRSKLVELPREDRDKLEANWGAIDRGMPWRKVLDLVGAPLSASNFTVDGPTKPWVFSGPGRVVIVGWDTRGAVTDVKEWRIGDRRSMPRTNAKNVDANWSVIAPGMDWVQVVDALGNANIPFFAGGSGRATGLWEFIGAEYTVTVHWNAEGRAELVNVVEKANLKAARNPELVDANWRQVTRGMDWRDVITILGGTHRAWFDAKSHQPADATPRYMAVMSGDSARAASHSWKFYGRNVVVSVYWGQDGKVKSCIGESRVEALPPLDMTLVDKNWREVKRGMTIDEVVALLGGTEDGRVLLGFERPTGYWAFHGKEYTVRVRWDHASLVDEVVAERQ